MKSNLKGIKNQTHKNILVSVMYQIIAGVCSLILPRYTLLYFGSDINGMIQSISQLLTYTMLMEFGIGGLITASLYKPLADKDEEAVSDIFNNSKNFFAKISYVFIGFAIILAVTAKCFIKTDYDFLYVSSMAVILGISYYFNYYFAISHRLLLRADQKIRIIQGVQSITLILNCALCIVAMKLGAGIHIVKAINALVFLINPIVFRVYVKKHYSISKTVYSENRKFPKKSDGVIHHLAYFIHSNTDIVLLSAFCGTREVSVYSVYNSIIYTIENFFAAVSDGIAAKLGMLIAKNDTQTLSDTFEGYRMINTAVATFVCIAEAVLIVPFVSVYTSGVSDVNYIRPAFAYIMIFAQWFYCVRIPYSNVITAAGHYRQTKFGAYIEVILNMGISVATVTKYGLCGVAIGTCVAIASRSVYMAWYLSKNILYRKLGLFAKDIIINIGFGILLCKALKTVFFINPNNIQAWFVYAVLISVIVTVAVVALNFITNRKNVLYYLKRIKNSGIFKGR